MTDVSYDVKTGRLTKDVEVKAIGNGFLMTGSIAVNRSFKKGEEWVEEASFFNFKQWFKSQKQVDFFAKQLKKGAQVTIDGDIIQERWEKDGKKQSAYVLMVNRIIPAFGNESGTSESSSGSSVPPATQEDGFPEDVPF